MTATNHALTGAAIALVLKKPELAIPAAFISHFILDLFPHYYPGASGANKFTSFEDNWARNLKQPLFVKAFTIDMLILLGLLVVLTLQSQSISPWTMFFSMLLAISPDFIGGRVLIYNILGIKRKRPEKLSLYTRFHHKLQWNDDNLYGFGVEIIWFTAMLAITIVLLR